MTAVLGIDPGGVTGLCLLWQGSTGLGCIAWQIGKLESPALVSIIADRQETHGKLFVVCEAFVMGRASHRGDRSGGQRARDLIGAVSSVSAPHTFRSAAHVKPWATDRRLDAAVGASTFRGLPHAKDAGRHALYAAVHDLGWLDPLARAQRGA